MAAYVVESGDYLTDGVRLVQVQHVLGKVVTVEEGSVDEPNVGTIRTDAIGDDATWRLIERPDTGEVDAWLRDRFSLVDDDVARELRLRMCGCSRCMARLAAEFPVED